MIRPNRGKYVPRETLDIKPVDGRECGSCTKCCEGYLRGKIGNTEMGLPTDNPYKPTPCYFLVEGRGCGIYKKRPIDPCRSYMCDWLMNPEIPEELKPEISQVIPSQKRTPNGHTYLEIIEAGQKMDPNVLSWYITYAMNKRINFLWVLQDGGARFTGNQQFCQEADYLLRTQGSIQS